MTGLDIAESKNYDSFLLCISYKILQAVLSSSVVEIMHTVSDMFSKCTNMVITNVITKEGYPQCLHCACRKYARYLTRFEK